MKQVLDLSKIDVELILRGLRALRRGAMAADSNISKQQAAILMNKISRVESQFEDLLEAYRS